MEYRGHSAIYEKLAALGIPFEYYEHPPLPTAEEAMKHRHDVDALHCKNLFFRNHKGNRHYLVIFEHSNNMAIRELEQILKQGKLSFASAERLQKYLRVIQGSVSPLGLVYDTEQHVEVFLDQRLKDCDKITFHPNDNTATLALHWHDFIRFMDAMGNKYSFIDAH
ncbi:MAG: hypothetical protein RIS47_1255 [Bacteroidota bacterium]|jgi:Ala-tRNA(Pro) deacylase